LEALPKEELLKYIKKQLQLSKDLKKKVQDLTQNWDKEKNEVERLEKEKKEWLSRGISAEFEKKDRLTKKDKELQLAAQLGAEMLEENDNLRNECAELQKQIDKGLVNHEKELQRLIKEKEELEESLVFAQEEAKHAKEEANECREALESAVLRQDDSAYDMVKENKDMKNKIESLEEQLKTMNPAAKIAKMKEKVDAVTKECKVNKELKQRFEEENTEKTSKITSFEQEIKQLKKEISDYQKKCKSDELECEMFRKVDDELRQELKASQDKCQELHQYIDMVMSERNENAIYTKQLDEEVQKLRNEKEKNTKTLKNMKTKLDRNSQMEEELKKHLNSLAAEREDLFIQNQKLTKEKRALQAKTKSKGKEKGPPAKDDENLEKIKDLEQHITALEAEHTELLATNRRMTDQTRDIHVKYQNLQKDFDSLSFEIDELTVSKNALNDENQNVKAENQKLIDGNESLLIEKESIVAQNNILQQEVRRLQQGSQDDREDETGDEWKCKYDSVLKEKEEVIANLDGCIKEKESLSTHCLQLENKIEAFKAKQSENQLTVSKLKDHVDELKNQLQQLNEEKLQQEQSLEELFSTHDDLQNKYDFECQERQKKEDAVSRLEEKLLSLKSHYQEGKEQTTIELERKISSLEETSQEQSHENSRLSQELDIKEQHVARLREELETISVKQNDIANNIGSKHEKKIEALTTELEQFQEDMRKLTEQASQEKASCAEELKAFEQASASLQVEKDALQSKVNELVGELEQMRKERLEFESGVNEKYAEYEAANQELQSRVTASLSAVEILKQQLKDLSTYKEENETVLQTCRVQLSERDMECECLGKKVKELEALVEGLKDDSEKSTLQIEKSSLQIELVDLKSGLESKDKEISDLKNCVENLKSELSVSEEANAKINEILDSKEEVLESYFSEIAALEKNIEKLKEKLCISEGANDVAKEKLAKNIEKLEEKLRVSEEAHDAAKEKLAKNEETLQNQSSEITSMSMQMENSTNELHEKQMVIDELQVNLLRQREELERLTAQLEVVKKQAEGAQKECSEMRGKVAEAEAQLSMSSNIAMEKVRELEDKVAATTQEVFLRMVKDMKKEDKEVQVQEDEGHSKVVQENVSHSEPHGSENHELSEDSLGNAEAEDTEELAHSEEKNIQVDTDDPKEVVDERLIEKDEQISKLLADLHAWQEKFAHIEELVMKKNDTAAFGLSESMLRAKDLEAIISSKQEEISALESEFSTIEMLLERTNESLEAKTKECEELYERVGTKTRRSSSQTSEELQAELEQYREHMTTLEDELQSALNRVEELESLLKEGNDKNGELESLVKEKGDKNNKFRNVAIKAKRELEALRQDAMQKEEDLQMEIKSLQEKTIFAQNELKHQKTACEKHEDDFMTMQSEIKSLQDEVEEQREKVSQLQSDLSRRENEVRALKDEMEWKNKEIEGQYEENEKKSKEIEQLRLDSDRKQESSQDVENDSNKSVEIENLRLELEKANKDLEVMRQNIEEKELKVVTLVDDLQAKNTLLLEHTAKNDEYIAKNEELAQKVEKMVVAISDKENKLSAVSDELHLKSEECSKLKQEFGNQSKCLEETRTKVDNLEQESAALKSTIEENRRQLQDANKETSKMSVINLEIEDYHRTIESLQGKINEKDKELSENTTQITKMNTDMDELKKELASVKSDVEDKGEKNKKFKSMIVKLKKDLSDSRKQELVHQEAQIEFNQRIQEQALQIDEQKVEAARLAAERENMLTQMKSATETNEVAYKGLEVKLARCKSDLQTSQLQYEELSSEYEKYKVRAHNVLKQQKASQQEVDSSRFEQEKTHMLETIDQLRMKLQELNQKLSMVTCDHEELETEHERLQTRHNQFVQEVTSKETGWKQRFEQIKVEMSAKIGEQQDKIKLLTNENETLAHSYKHNTEVMEEEKKSHSELVASLKDQIEALRDMKETAPLQKNPPAEPKRQQSTERANTSQASLDTSRLSLDLGKPLAALERSEGEGMDQSQLELIDTISQKSAGSVTTTPITPSAAGILEKILSTSSSPADVISSLPTSPGVLRDEISKLKSVIVESHKKVDHLTELLRDSEANASRLDEQALVLKEEIRRLERNEDRERALSNMEYLKNVIIKFLKVRTAEKEHLIPVITSMLKLSNEERDFLVEYAKGEIEADDGSGSWSSYVYRWTSLS